MFVSYSRRDDAGEWVKRLVEALRDAASDDFDVHFDPNKEVFFDRDDLRLGEEWKTQLARAIREAEVLLVCVSKSYFESKFCLWEFQEYETKPTGPDNPPGLVPLLLEDTARDDQPDEEHQHWHDRIHQVQAHDLRNLFTRMAVAAVPEELTAQVQVLSDELYQQKQERRRKDAAIGNLTRGTSRFVGRHQELTQLGDALESPSTVGVVTAVRGLGGIGKTELVRHYGNRHRGHYAGGIWQIPAEGAREMLPLLARLAPDLPGFQLPEEVQGNPKLTGRHVLMELRRHAVDSHVLLILDNVSEPALLTDPQVGVLPQDSGVHVAVTTRLGTEDFAGSSRLKQIHLQGLSIRESVSLLQAFQPSGGGHRADFRSEDDRAAAEELAELLDGFTLAVEQAGVYLSTHPEDTVRDYLNHLRSQNLTASDTMLDDDSKTRMEHREKLLSVILEQSLTDLEHTLPGSLQVLRLAAAMPPDTIPWPWLEDLTKRTNPEVCEPTPQFLKGRWTRIRRTLEGRDLITEGRHPGATGRMHRLVADHLKTHNPQETDLVNDFIIHRARKLGGDFTQAPELWEIDTLTDALPRILQNTPGLLEQIPDFIRHVALRYTTDTRITAMLQNLTRRLSNINIQTRYLTHVLLGDSLRNVEPIKASENYKKSLNTIRDLAKDSPDDPWILQNLAVSLDNTSDMLHSTDPERALKQYRESLRIRRDLAKVRSGDLRIKRGIAISLSNIADIVRNADPEQSLALYQESLTILRDLAEAQPHDLRTQRDLTVSLDNMANMLSNINPEQALGLYQESLAIRRDLTKTQPGDFLTLRDLTISLNNVADMLEHSDPRQALELYQESLAITRTIAEARPNDLEALRDLGLSLNNVSSMLCSGDHEQSLELYQKSLNIARSLLEARSGDPHSRRDLTVSLENFAYMLKNTDPEQALRFYQESLTIRRGLVETQPDNLLALRDLTESLNGVGDMLRDTYPEQALSLYQEALATARRLAERLPGNIQAQRDLTIPLDNVADMLSSIDHEQALKLYQESLIITRNLTKQLPDNLQAKRDLADSLHRVAHMLENSDPRQALNLHQESLLLTRSLAEQLPGDLEAQRDLTLSLCNVAYMLENSDPGQALNLHRESLVIARRLVETRSDNLQAKRDLTVSLNNVAGMLHGSDPEQAVNLYRESLIIASFLAERLPKNLQALWDLGISAVRLAQLLPTKDPEQVSLLREAAISFRDALAIQPEHQELGDLSYHVALYYAYCDPDDRDKWFTYADELAERFGFEED